MTTYYRNQDNQVFNFHADIDYQNQKISGYQVMLESGEQVYTGTIELPNVTAEEFEQHIQQFVTYMKQKLEPLRIQLS